AHSPQCVHCCRADSARLSPCPHRSMCIVFLFFKATAPPDTYTLSLHDALPILPLVDDAPLSPPPLNQPRLVAPLVAVLAKGLELDRKSTRLNSSHVKISYAVFCLKKKNAHNIPRNPVQHKQPCEERQAQSA